MSKLFEIPIGTKPNVGELVDKIRALEKENERLADDFDDLTSYSKKLEKVENDLMDEISKLEEKIEAMQSAFSAIRARAEEHE